MRAYLLFEKRLPPYLRGVVSWDCRMIDAEGSKRKNVSPLSGIRLSILSSCFFAVGFLVRTTCKVEVPAFLHLLCICFFAEGFLVWTTCKVEAPWRFCTYCAFAFLPKVFWFGPFIRSKPLGVFALIVRLLFCRRFFGSDHL